MNRRNINLLNTADKGTQLIADKNPEFKQKQRLILFLSRSQIPCMLSEYQRLEEHAKGGKVQHTNVRLAVNLANDGPVAFRVDRVGEKGKDNLEECWSELYSAFLEEIALAYHASGRVLELREFDNPLLKEINGD